MRDRVRLYHDNFSDVHFGTQDPKEYFEIELVPILEGLHKRENIGIITFAGEIWEKRMPSDDPSFIYSLKFIDEIRSIVRNKSGVLAMCKGTLSHEANQYEAIKELMSDIFVFDKIGYLDYDGFIFRFIPDLSYNSYNEFKDLAFTRQADITVMHGLIEGALPMINAAQHVRKKEVIIKKRDLKEYTNLYTVAGHIHERLRLDQDIWYTSALSASSYKDANKTEFGYDSIRIFEDDEYEVFFNKNKNTRVYKKENVTQLFKNATFESVRSQLILKKKSLLPREYVRLDIHDSSLTIDELAVLRSIKAQFGNVFDFNVIVDDIEVDDKTANTIRDDAAKILNPNIPVEEKILEDIHDNPNIRFDLKRRLTNEKIEYYITHSIEDIVGGI